MTTKQFTLPGILAAPRSAAEVDPAELIAAPQHDMYETTCALALLKAVLTIEAGYPLNRGYLLDSYAECLRAVKGEREPDSVIGTPASGYIN